MLKILNIFSKKEDIKNLNKIDFFLNLRNKKVFGRITELYISPRVFIERKSLDDVDAWEYTLTLYTKDYNYKIEYLILGRTMEGEFGGFENFRRGINFLIKRHNKNIKNIC